MIRIRSARNYKRIPVAILGVLGVWFLFAALVVPALIRSAYRGESLGLINRMITGQSIHSVDTYLAAWSSIATRLTLALVTLLIVVSAAILFDARERFTQWSRRFSEREAKLKLSPEPTSPSSYFLVVLWCGLAAGFWESTHLTKKMILGEWLPVTAATSLDTLWTAPLSNAIIFAILGMVLFAVARRRPSWLSLKWVVFVAAFIGLISIFRSTGRRLELYGAIPLALGLALVGGRLTAAYSRGFLRLVRRTLPAALAIIAVLAVGITAESRISERRALARLPDASSGAPNVLLIFLDTVRSKSLSLYGYHRPTTPSLERLAQRGVVFDHAVATAGWTLPTHATVFTGRHHHELTVDFKKPLDDTYPTLAEYMQDNGYATAGFVANFYYCGPQYGLNRGFLRYEHRPVTLLGIIESSWLGRELLIWRGRITGNHQKVPRKTAAGVNREFLDWLDAADESRAFFAFLNYFDAHSPYLPPKPFNLRFSDTQPRYWLEPEAGGYSAEHIRELTDAYDGSIAYLDDQLGRLFDELEARGVLENTLVIVTSDHGEQFGENGLMYHSNSLYMPLLHVPLLVSFPTLLPSGVRVNDPVSLRDIAATIVDLLDLPASPFPGRSIAGYWDDRPGVPVPEERSIVLSEITVNRRIPETEPAAYGPMQSLVEGRLHYIRRGDGAEELYDLSADPDERNDLAATEVGRSHLEDFRTRLDAVLRPAAVAGEPDSVAGEPDSVDSYSGGISSGR